ncbi:hypothetical protein HXY33_05640 [Candidatus Bathyarchaeota archaeon]|nr:hypothetical protein [Candidatus Bathyarchaeota archaeon]
MNRKIIAVAALIVVVVLVASLSLWFLYRYDATVLSLTYEATPITSSPLSGVNYTWVAKAYSVRLFGNAPFDGKGYVYRERVTSENRFRRAEFQNLNASLRLRIQITNQTGYMICNETLENTDGCNRQIILEIKPEHLRVGSTLQIRITLNLNVNYNYGAGGEPKQFTLQKEWTRTIQVQQTEPPTGDVF